MFFYTCNTDPYGRNDPSSSDDDDGARAFGRGSASARRSTTASTTTATSAASSTTAAASSATTIPAVAATTTAAATDLVRGATITLEPTAADGLSLRIELVCDGPDGPREAPAERAPRKRVAAVEAAAAAAAADAAAGRVCTICFDLGLGADMGDTEAKALANQLALVYGYNKRLSRPLALAFSGLDAASTPGAPGQLSVCGALAGWGWERWQLRREAGPPWEAFAQQPLVYLTADSPHVLTELKPGVAYIIGGMVDHTPKPGVSLGVAEAHGVATCRLPLDEHVTVRKPALTCLACFQILAGFERCGDWGRAVREAPAMHCAPMRKYVQWKTEEGRAAQQAPRPLRLA